MIRKFLALLLVPVSPLLVLSQIDTVNKTSKMPAKVKPYKEVITAKANTSNGLFKVHKVEERYFFEIPDTLLERDILTVNRISKAAADVRPQGGFFGYAGDQIGENVIRFSKGPNNRVFIKRISYQEQSKDSSANGMYRSVLNSNFQPIVAAFDIKAFSADSSGTVIDFTDYINGDNDVLFFEASYKKAFGLTALQADKSYISKLNAYPQNIEISTVKTYSGAEGTIRSFELNCSLILLPTVPMRSRYYDNRVGFFSTGYRNFDVNPQGVENTLMITRWRLEPKPEDISNYKRGELVEPAKPIVFYIDPATPKKWVPYLIQGVNDWQKAFEKAGFKNAVYAREAPVNDSSWSMEDARHNVIVYKPSTLSNAYGPEIHDPRSGEILETHVGWFHNVMQLVHDWYMVQAGAIDPAARKMEFDEELMGQLIRFVSSHEVGHTLGLAHNFGSSSTIPVDSLRSKHYVETNGHTPSIMDYARFNYVAQPEDSISEQGIFPRIGMYDEWAIEWGYRWLPEIKQGKEEKAFMNKWILQKLASDKRFWFGEQSLSYYIDPRSQSEDIGDDAMKAGTYGIKNLRRIMPQIQQWTKQSGENYLSLRRIYNQVLTQYERYLTHTASNVGGTTRTNTTSDQAIKSVKFVDRKKQKAAIQFLQDELFATPLWLFEQGFDTLIYQSPTITLLALQKSALATITSHLTLYKLLNFEVQKPTTAYTIDELFTDLENGIWKEIVSKQKITVYRRNLQKLYADRLNFLLNNNSNTVWIFQDWKSVVTPFIDYTDEHSIIKAHAEKLLKQVNAALPSYKDELMKKHLKDLQQRLKKAIKPEAENAEKDSKSPSALNGNINNNDKAKTSLGCWGDLVNEQALY